MSGSYSRSHRSQAKGRYEKFELSREEHKELTRQALLRSALRLLDQNSFDSISLREVTREAGITPTAFYRHFADMEELGLVLVQEAFGSLREMLKAARDDSGIARDVIRRSVQLVVIHVRDNESHIRFIARERHGGVRRIRRSIAREVELFSLELAEDLEAFPVVGAWSTNDRFVLADLIVNVMVALAFDLIDSERSSHEDRIVRAERQLRLVAFGISAWRSSPSR